jgi:hypothetical protein
MWPVQNAPSEDVIPALAQVHLLVRGPGPLSFQSGVVARGGALTNISGARFARAIFASFDLI